MKLKPTQIEVLKTLARNKGTSLGIQDIKEQCTVKNTGHIKSAIYYFIDNDLVYQPDIDGEIRISPDGLSVIAEYL